ncbi:unnamed protein product [Adineta steineri]|uniref:oleoyl-[acyl-carrier-protein] hydrolase n=1 Tax=Adineta steineri TaxID=433720 RepID=A0A814J2J5_9BILA|nr:unnamed protein product [Adineta steineri]
MAANLANNHPWFEVCHPRPAAKYQVFIFPSAGQAGHYYREWDKNFPEYEFSIVIYPGRGSRFGDKLLTEMKDYITELDKGLLPFIKKPCIFIGHSLGTAVSFALAKHMVDKKNKNNFLKLLLEMGRGPPHLIDPDEPFENMNDKDLTAELKRLADPSQGEIYDYPDFMAMILPMFRADSRVAGQLLEQTPLDIPIICYGGDKEEKVDEAFINRWKELTTKHDLFRVRMFHGHHHFQSECEAQVLQALQEDFRKINSL